MKPFTIYCTALALIGIVLNAFFLIVTKLQRIERIQEVLIFLRSISFTYILVAVCMLAVAPQSITLGATNICIPHGLLVIGNSGASSNFMNGLTAFGISAFLFTALSFALLFLYHYRKTAGQMSTVFAPKNIPVFLGTFGLFCLVQAILLFYSKVDSNYLLERLTRSKKWEEVQLGLGFNPNSSNMQFELGSGGLTAINLNNRVRQEQQQQLQQQQQQGNQSTNIIAVVEAYKDGGRGEAAEARILEGIFGTDYSRNPLYFLSNGVLAMALALASVITMIIALVITCNLCGKQESMSDKSQMELQKFTLVLTLEAFLPVFLVTAAGVNYIVCKIMGESFYTFQEFFAMLVIAPIPALFPTINLFLVKEFRHLSWDILICKIWTRKQRQAKAAAERKAMENIDEELASATRNKNRNKHMKSLELPAPVASSQLSIPSIDESSGRLTSTMATQPTHLANTNVFNKEAKMAKPEESERYVTALDEAHRQARALFGKQN